LSIPAAAFEQAQVIRDSPLMISQTNNISSCAMKRKKNSMSPKPPSHPTITADSLDKFTTTKDGDRYEFEFSNNNANLNVSMDFDATNNDTFNPTTTLIDDPGRQMRTVRNVPSEDHRLHTISSSSDDKPTILLAPSNSDDNFRQTGKQSMKPLHCENWSIDEDDKLRRDRPARSYTISGGSEKENKDLSVNMFSVMDPESGESNDSGSIGQLGWHQPLFEKDKMPPTSSASVLSCFIDRKKLSPRRVVVRPQLQPLREWQDRSDYSPKRNQTEEVDSTQLQVLDSPKRTKNISISCESPPSKGAHNMGHTFYDHPRPAPQCNRPSRNQSKVPTFTPKKNFSPRGSSIFGNAAFRLKKKPGFQSPRFLPPHSTLASAPEDDFFPPSPTVGLDLDERIDDSKVQRRPSSPPSRMFSGGSFEADMLSSPPRRSPGGGLTLFGSPSGNKKKGEGRNLFDQIAGSPPLSIYRNTEDKFAGSVRINPFSPKENYGGMVLSPVPTPTSRTTKKTHRRSQVAPQTLSKAPAPFMFGSFDSSSSNYSGGNNNRMTNKKVKNSKKFLPPFDMPKASAGKLLSIKKTPYPTSDEESMIDAAGAIESKFPTVAEHQMPSPSAPSPGSACSVETMLHDEESFEGSPDAMRHSNGGVHESHLRTSKKSSRINSDDNTEISPTDTANFPYSAPQTQQPEIINFYNTVSSGIHASATTHNSPLSAVPPTPFKKSRLNIGGDHSVTSSCSVLTSQCDPMSSSNNSSNSYGGIRRRNNYSRVENRNGFGPTSQIDYYNSCPSAIDPMDNRHHQYYHHHCAPAPKSRFAEDFEEIGKLGTGSFGMVYKCLSKLDGCMYAVKVARREAKGVADRDRMLKEVYALAALSDRAESAAFHIVRYHQAWMEDDRLYIQTELCTSTLQEEKSTQFDEQRCFKLLREILLALELLHKNDMVHLDIKPENIFYKNNQWKLGDFGLVSKITSHNDVEEGDSRYMSMELLSGDHSDLTKSDVFSLGASLYEVCLGRPLPANGDEWQRIRAGILYPMPHISQDLRKLIIEMMNPEASQRPTAKHLLQRRQLMSEEQQQLLTERNKAEKANMALAAHQKQTFERFKIEKPSRRKMVRSSTWDVGMCGRPFDFK